MIPIERSYSSAPPLHEAIPNAIASSVLLPKNPKFAIHLEIGKLFYIQNKRLASDVEGNSMENLRYPRGWKSPTQASAVPPEVDTLFEGQPSDHEIQDEKTFEALKIGDRVISTVKKILYNGSPNQVEDLNKNSKIFRMYESIRKAADKIEKSYPQVEFKKLGRARGLTAGLAAYYATGACGESTSLGYTLLCAHLPPGYTVSRMSCDESFLSHNFPQISWEGCSDPVVVDAWPKRARACLYSQYWANPQCYGRSETPSPLSTFIAREKIKVSADKIYLAFSELPNEAASHIKPHTEFECLNQMEINALELGESIFNRQSSFSDSFPNGINYIYKEKSLENDKNSTLFFSNPIGYNEAKNECFLKNLNTPERLSSESSHDWIKVNFAKQSGTIEKDSVNNDSFYLFYSQKCGRSDVSTRFRIPITRVTEKFIEDLKENQGEYVELDWSDRGKNGIEIRSQDAATLLHK